MTKQRLNRLRVIFLLSSIFLARPLVAQTNGPTLRMASSNGTSTVFWPLTSYFDILQTTTNLTPSATWANVATAERSVSLTARSHNGVYGLFSANIIGNEIAFPIPAFNGQLFFRLSTPSLINLCDFAIFYNGLLEFSQCATMVVNGRVHANGPIYVGTSAVLTFNAPVTTSSTVSSPIADGQGPWTTNNWNTYFNGNPSYVTNVSDIGIPSLNWTNLHSLIDIPPSSEYPASYQGSQRLYNQAQLVLIVTNNISGSGNPTVQLTIQNSVNGTVPGNDPAPTILYYINVSPALLSSNLPFLSLTNTFNDQREQKSALVTQLDIGKYAAWAATNGNVQGKLPSTAGVYPTIMYIADRRNVSATQLAVVRLCNAAQLPQNNSLGFTIVTPNPLYVWGNYNVQTSSSVANASAGTTNTAYTVPAALISDSITILASTWTDQYSYTPYSQGLSTDFAADTTVNAALMTGTVPSTGNNATNFSGGLHNLPRLLQNWSGYNLWLNTSIIRLWDSTLATNQFRNPAGFTPPPVNPYYNPPTRHFNFDQNFLNPAKIPPGIPFFD